MRVHTYTHTHTHTTFIDSAWTGGWAVGGPHWHLLLAFRDNNDSKRYTPMRNEMLREPEREIGRGGLIAYEMS